MHMPRNGYVHALYRHVISVLAAQPASEKRAVPAAMRQINHICNRIAVATLAASFFTERDFYKPRIPGVSIPYA
ncbi:MAG: hypothetical protein BWY95_02476 [Bacteroidetes bacterium ADurb.BinA104]|nr:MAG: hypothetical protein BWY95_02476 [Bacteroidetes bacterium ADurb.BinA104]